MIHEVPPQVALQAIDVAADLGHNMREVLVLPSNLSRLRGNESSSSSSFMKTLSQHRQILLALELPLVEFQHAQHGQRQFFPRFIAPIHFGH